MEEKVAEAQSGNEEMVEQLLVSYSPFIKKTASFVCKKYIDEQMDEYSIALSAFYDAIVKYEDDKNASFMTFAHLLIRRKLIDYIRKEIRSKEVSYGVPSDNDDEYSDYFSKLQNSSSLEQFTAEQQAEERKEEMRVYSELLSSFGLTFNELVSVSPSHSDTRQTAIQIAQIIIETPEFYDSVMEKKRLPIKELESLVEVSRKTIERQRKYILSIVILLGSDLIYLKDYVKGRLL